MSGYFGDTTLEEVWESRKEHKSSCVSCVPFSSLVPRVSVPREFEIAFHVTVIPGTGKRTVIGKDVVQFAIDHEVNRVAGRVPGIGFDMDGPFGGVQCHHLHWNNVR